MFLLWTNIQQNIIVNLLLITDQIYSIDNVREITHILNKCSWNRMKSYIRRYFVHSKFTLHRIQPFWLLNKDMIWGKTLYFVHPKSTLHRICPSWLLSKDMIWGNLFCFVHPRFTLLCMSILTLEQILIWVLVLVLDMKVLDVLKYLKKKLRNWPVHVLGIYL